MVRRRAHTEHTILPNIHCLIIISSEFATTLKFSTFLCLWPPWSLINLRAPPPPQHTLRTRCYLRKEVTSFPYCLVKYYNIFTLLRRSEGKLRMKRIKKEHKKEIMGVKGKPDTIDIIERKRLQRYGHVKRMSEERILKLFME